MKIQTLTKELNVRIQTHKIGDAFANGEKFTAHNTVSTGSELTYHKTKIAWIKDEWLYFTLGGYNTVTTRKRLSPAVYAWSGWHVTQKDWKPIFRRFDDGDTIEREMDDCAIYRVDHKGRLGRVDKTALLPFGGLKP